MHRNLIKIFVVLGILGFLTLVYQNTLVFESHAEKDEILREIAGYKTWTKMTKEPIKVDVTFAGITS
ncbi:MAG: hypothetical protein R2747_20450 [Pyrinomonadaceae bacterium]